MSDSFQVTIVGLDPYVAGMREAQRILRRELLVAGRRVAKLGEGLAKRYAPVWRGVLRASIHSGASALGNVVEAFWGTVLDYAAAVEEGRRAGATAPPPGALLPWMAAHGIPESAEFVVGRAISRRGIPARPFVGRALRELRGAILDEFRQAVRRALAQIGGR